MRRLYFKLLINIKSLMSCSGPFLKHQHSVIPANVKHLSDELHSSSWSFSHSPCSFWHPLRCDHPFPRCLTLFTVQDGPLNVWQRAAAPHRCAFLIKLCKWDRICQQYFTLRRGIPPLKMTTCFTIPMMSGSKIYRPPLPPRRSHAEGNYPALHPTS